MFALFLNQIRVKLSKTQKMPFKVRLFSLPERHIILNADYASSFNFVYCVLNESPT